MANENERDRVNGTAGRSGNGESPIPPIKNPAVEGAQPRRNYWLPWVLLALAILALLAMLSQCGRDDDKINEAIARDQAAQSQTNTVAGTAVVPGAPGTYQQGTLAYDVNQYIMSNARAERTFTFGALNFDSGSAEIRDIDRSDIGALANALSQRPGVRAAVVGYADARGEDRANARLGMERARAVIAALKQRGVDVSNIKARTGGELNPVAGNSAQGMAENRRTEFVLLGR